MPIMPPTVTVDRLSKCYRIGKMKHETMLREAIAGMFKPKSRDKDEESLFWAMRDVSFEVDEGEVVGIVGRNGAGKSTLLKLVSRITHPTSGSVSVRGRVASLLEVGTGFHQELSGRENIYLNGSILGMKKREVDAKLDQIIEFSGVSMFLDTPIKRYSSGMRLRLGFAVAAHLEPDVLIVDEVLAVGDVAFQRKCLTAMSDLQSGGRTVLFVSHNMEAIENLCPRVIWIDKGGIRRDGPSSSVIREYMSTYAQPSDGDLDLRTYDDRSGSGDIRYTGVEILAKDRTAKDIMRSGDSVVVRLNFEAKKRIMEPHFGFKLSTEMGTLLTDLSTWTTGLEIPELPPGPGRIDFEIDSLNLMPGRLLMSLWIRSVGPVHYDVLDNFMEFKVEPGNVFESGRGIKSRYGLMFFPCTWHPPELG